LQLNSSVRRQTHTFSTHACVFRTLNKGVIPPEKVRDYLLSPVHPVGRAKARFCAALGFRQAEWPLLQAALRAQAEAGEAEPVASAYGRKFEVRGMLQGPGGRDAAVVTVWIILAGEEAPRLVTAVPGDRP
jgi:hypothetical protein